MSRLLDTVSLSLGISIVERYPTGVSHANENDMCGIVGFIDFSKTQTNYESIIKSMSTAITHRGPDGDGVWIEPEVGLALGHRRLAIHDISDLGKQPMISQDGRYVISFNGEIYNFKRLKSELVQRGVTLQGHSDTEVFLEYISHNGLVHALGQSEGMFAFALYDNLKDELSLVRDRLGKKPLYYSNMDSTLIFGSELKALERHPSFKREINKKGAMDFFQYGHISAPLTIYKNTHKILPGSILTFCTKNPDLLRQPKEEQYWSLGDVSQAGLKSPFEGSLHEASNELEKLLHEVISDQLQADVPVGMFLSGGIDSSAIVSIAQKINPAPIRTFSIGFEQKEFDESLYARDVAKHLGTQHTELVCRPEDALDAVDKLNNIYDEPFADPSQIPTLLLSHLTRKAVTVSLSGDAGDELFHGYSRYFKMGRRNQFIQKAPRMAGVGSSIAARVFQGSAVPAKYQRYGDTFEKISRSARQVDRHLLSYMTMFQVGRSMQDILAFSEELNWARDFPPQHMSFEGQMRFADTLNYLPDEIMVKFDRASMSASLETRCPLMNHKIVEFAYSLPDNLLYAGGVGKLPLRTVLDRYVPNSLTNRPKMGFGVPLASWFRNELRQTMEDTLFGEQDTLRDWFHDDKVRKLWYSHLSGKRDCSGILWSVFVFMKWLKNYQT